MTDSNQNLSVIQSILLDFEQVEFVTGTIRRLVIEQAPTKATICMSVRRSGKSTYLFQVIADLLRQGVSRQNILYLNFFDDRLHRLSANNLGLILEAFYGLYPEKKHSEKVYFFFDEIQAIPGWESFVDRVMRTENCQVYLTGSSAHLLSTEIATQMRGRALSWEMFPFSFQEFIDARELEYSDSMPTKQRLLIQKAFGEYWQTGGFPEVLNVSELLRIKIHQEYFHAILFRDLIERHDASHPQAILNLAYWLIDNTGSLYSINKLTSYLKTLGHKVSKSSIGDYLSWFEDAYFLFSVRLFDASWMRSNTNPKKIYCIDHSLVTSISSKVLVNSGHLLENLVFIALRQISPDIFYYKTKQGREVDFIVTRARKERLLVQVCESIEAEPTKQRELVALNEAMVELGLAQGYLVTQAQADESSISVAAGNIKIIPIWRFLLTLGRLN